MEKIIMDYMKLRKQRTILVLDWISGIFLIIYTLIYSCIANVDIKIYLIGYIVICLSFWLVKFIIKSHKIYGFFNKIEFKSLLKLNKLYDSFVHNENYHNVELQLNKLEKKQKNIIYNYLRDTKTNYKLYKIWDLILLFLGVSIGAIFNEKGKITTELLSNVIVYSSAAILAIMPFYIIFIKIYNSYNKLVNFNIIKAELIYYINEYSYNDVKII